MKQEVIQETELVPGQEDTEKRSRRKREIFYPVLLLMLAALVIVLSYVPGSLYGSTTDWFAQHVSIAETIRQTILEEGTLFPGQLPLGGGSNIYDFAYYGYLRPDVLFGCLLPGVAMETIITVYSVAGYLCSVLLFYLFLKKAGLKAELALLGGILFLGAGSFYHIHRHIMFINYMPFLLGALLCVLRYHRTGKKALLILMLTLIYLHSYYYSISCLLVIYLFFLYTARWEPGVQSPPPDNRRFHAPHIARCGRWWSLTWHYALWVLASVAMAGSLLLPTAASVLNCASAKDGGSAGTDPLQMTWNMEGLLYNGYGLGLTLIALFLLLLSLCRRRARLLAAGILFALVCGLVPLVLNGFLYNRAKILIPFLPLVLYLCMETLWEFWSRRRRPVVLFLIPIAWVTYLQYKAHKIPWVWVDLVLVILVCGVLWWRWWLRREQKAGLKEVAAATAERFKPEVAVSLSERLPTAAFTGVLTVMCGLVFFFAIELHRNDSYITKEHTVISAFSEDEREDFYREENYRFDTFLKPYSTSNRLLAYGVGRATMYTSTANPLYSQFFYDEIRTPIGNNNRVGLYERANPFLLYLMGVRYLETTTSNVPVGYQIVKQEGTAVLAEREDVLPLCYGSVNLLSREAYEQLEFPENLEALASASIVEGTGTAFTSHFTELHPQEGVDYRIERISETEFTVIPREPVEHKILVVTFQVKNNARSAVTIAVNGIQNKLSGASAPYPNDNETFTYLLSSNEAMTEFKVETSGNFEIEDLRIYSMDASYLGNRSIVPFKEEPAGPEGQEAGAGLGQKEMARGTITMPKDGYLITSYPMQPGYRAWVDGVEVPVETVNTAFVGLPLTAGTHQVELVYEPPLQQAGLVMSLAGWLLWAGFLAAEQIGKGRKSGKAPGLITEK